MAKRIVHDTDFMHYVMTPPAQDSYMQNDIKIDSVKVLDKNRCNKCVETGLGQVPGVSTGSNESQSWVMPVVIIVVSAMALMTLYAVLSKR